MAHRYQHYDRQASDPARATWEWCEAPAHGSVPLAKVAKLQVFPKQLHLDADAVWAAVTAATHAGELGLFAKFARPGELRAPWAAGGWETGTSLRARIF
jgi:hypothetical protein